MPAPESIVFLDIDGVLNNDDWLARNGQLSCDPENIASLNGILAETGAEIVVSSDWRKWMSWTELCDRLLGSGLEGIIRDRTPVIDAAPLSGETPHRGREVTAWLQATGFKGSFVILDDRSDLEPHLPFLIRTGTVHGLTDHEAQLAIEILGRRKKVDPFSGIDDAEL